MGRIYMYGVVRDFGFAPNPFHGYCTLATCKPKIRNLAKVGDWVIGMGALRLKAMGQCVYAMCITEKITFNEYWTSPKYLDKMPIRNGSRKMMVGDNIYYFDPVREEWSQADSHHSNADGSVNPHNLAIDTKSDKVLISNRFFYFGKEAPCVPINLLNTIEYKKNPRDYRVFEDRIASRLIEWLHSEFRGSLNQVMGDPFDFDNSEKRYSKGNDKIS